MKLKYKIEVHMEPNDKGEYFWIIGSINIDNPKSNWCTSIAGWSKTPEEAFVEAKRFYDKYKKDK